jgi:hypothetical protein
MSRTALTKPRRKRKTAWEHATWERKSGTLFAMLSSVWKTVGVTIGVKNTWIRRRRWTPANRFANI